ncbi:MAG: PAS domain S-box protein [Verrucomicrobiales bacterium]
MDLDLESSSSKARQTSCSDKRERDAANSAVCESNWFNSAFHYAPIGMALVSPEGRFLKVNPALCGILGYGEDELLHATFQELTHPNDLQADLLHVQEMLEKKRPAYQMEKRYFHKNGTIIWVSLSVSLVWGSDGTPQFFVSQIEDITARKNAEEKLIQSHLQLQQLLRERDELRKGLLTICAWTKQIRIKDKWVSVEHFLKEKFGISTSHGISDEALSDINRHIDELKRSRPSSTSEV